MAGVHLLAETARASGLDAGLSVALSRWRKPRAVHDPGKVVLDLALTLAVGGDCPADTSLLRAGADLFGPVASAPTICRLVDALAADLDAALIALRSARAEARAWAAHLAGQRGQDESQDADAGERGEVIVDLDATLVRAHSEKESAAPTYKRGFGFHPLMAYLDHGPAGTGEGLAALLRPGNANAGTAADHVAVLDLVEEQLTDAERARLVLRTDTAGGTHAFLNAVVERGYGYSVGFYARADVAAAIETLPDSAWVPAIDAEAEVREGAWVAELSDSLDLNGWPAGMRVIARKERPHPGAQLRLTDADGHRVTCFATDAHGEDLPGLELRHRRRARVEDRIRTGKDTGLANLPYQDAASNQIWLELALLAQDLLAWLQLLALDGEHALTEPKRLRLHLFTIAGRLVRSARRTILNLDATWPWATVIMRGLQRLQALPAPG